MGFQVRYAALDRLVHRVAFAAPFVQLTAADIEGAVFGAGYEAVAAGRPVFIASLPRAGTTLLLRALDLLPLLATQSYRDMPFVLAPILWSRLSGAFRKPGDAQERSHGDGVPVDYDSPEAFEEVLWKAFWPEKYAGPDFPLWRAADEKADARLFFIEHMKKVIAIRRPDRAGDGRYLSKNNGNLARLDLVGRMFPDATIVVPFRRPAAHAASLHRQQRVFTDLHARDRFVRRYMADLGHYEFGDLHRPIAFPGMRELIADRDPLTGDYWLGYWIAAFDYLRARRENVVLVCYEGLCANARDGLAGLCERLDLPTEGRLEAAAALFKAPSPLRGDGPSFAPDLRDRAEALYSDLLGLSRGA